MTVGVHSVTREWAYSTEEQRRPRGVPAPLECGGAFATEACRRRPDRRMAQKARVKPPLDPAKREFTTLLKIDPNE